MISTNQGIRFTSVLFREHPANFGDPTCTLLMLFLGFWWPKVVSGVRFPFYSNLSTGGPSLCFVLVLSVSAWLQACDNWVVMHYQNPKKPRASGSSSHRVNGVWGRRVPWSNDAIPSGRVIWVWLKLNRRGYAGFGPCCH